MTQNFSLPSLQPPTQFSEFQYTVASTTSFHLSRVSIYRPACFNLPSPRSRVFIYRGFSIYRPPSFNLPSPRPRVFIYRVFSIYRRLHHGFSIYRRDHEFQSTVAMKISIYRRESRPRVFNLPSRSRVFNLPSRSRVFNLPSRPRVFNLPSR